MAIKPSHLLLPIAGLIAIGLMIQKKAAGALNYFINKVGIAIEGITPVLRLDVMVQNPTNSQFVVRSITGNVSADGAQIGTGSLFQTITIYPNDQAVLPIYVRLSPLAIVSDIVSLITKGSGIPKTITFSGYINVNQIVSDINLSYNVS